MNTNGTPNVLMELTVDAYTFLKCNSIHLSGMTIINRKTSYSNIRYHNDVQKFIPKCCNGSNNWNEINLNRMRNNYVLVTVEKLEMIHHKDVNNVTYMTNGVHSEAEGSGKLLLLLVRLQKKKKKNSLVWKKKHFDAVKSCKKVL